METLLAFVVGIFAALGAGVVAYLTYLLCEGLYYELLLAPALEHDLGFRHGTAGLPADGDRSYISAVSIHSVTDGGVFDQAGFQTGDVLPDLQPTYLFKLLHRHRGRVAELSVVDGGHGPPFQWRSRRVLHFAVPPRGKRIRHMHGKS